jgi:hypothetical protein
LGVCLQKCWIADKVKIVTKMLLACTTSPESFLLAFAKLDSQETESLADKKQVNLPLKKDSKS